MMLHEEQVGQGGTRHYWQLTGLIPVMDGSVPGMVPLQASEAAQGSALSDL